MTTELASKYIKLRPRQPNPPVNVDPPEGGSIGLTPTLTSGAFSSNEVNGEVHIGSRWKISTNSDMSSPLYDSGVTTDLLVHTPNLTLSGTTTYYWTVSHIGARGGESEDSTPTSMATLQALSELSKILGYSGNAGVNNIVTGLNMSVNEGFIFSHTKTSAFGVDYLYLVSTESVGTDAWRMFNNISNYSSMGLTTFNTDGYSLSGGPVNFSGEDYSSISGLVSPGFCDIVTWIGDGTGPTARAIPHNLGMKPGAIIPFPNDGSTDRSFGMWFSTFAADEVKNNNTNLVGGSNLWGSTLPDANNFYVAAVGGSSYNDLGVNYLALVFPENSPLNVVVDSYIGTGVAGEKITTPKAPGWFIIAPDVGPCSIHDAISGVSASFVPGVNTGGSVRSLIQSFDSDGFTLTAEADVNTLGTRYTYLFIPDENA